MKAFLFVGLQNKCKLLIAFSKEDQQVIEDKAKEQEEVAMKVSEIVGKLENDFNQVLEQLIEPLNSFRI